MALKCLNPDSIRPLTGRPKSSALCSVDNTSSLVYRVPIRSRLIPRTASVGLSTFIPLRFITSSNWSCGEIVLAISRRRPINDKNRFLNRVGYSTLVRRGLPFGTMACRCFVGLGSIPGDHGLEVLENDRWTEPPPMTLGGGGCRKPDGEHWSASLWRGR